MSNNSEIYALCYCAQFDFIPLQSFLLENDRCTAYRNVLVIEWHEGEVFLFDFGVLVFWKLNSIERAEFIERIKAFAENPLQALIEDTFTFEINNDKIHVKNDHIHLNNDDIMTRLAVSHGIAQSTKLAQFENRIQETINENSYIPKNIAEQGESKLSRSELAKLRGRLFISRSDIMLNYDLLDTPDFFWDYPELDQYFSILIDYLEVKQRLEVLNKKLETIDELFDMIADELKHKHSSLLEWIIIWLIAIEIVMFLVHDIFKVY
ncbi:MAG: RMD1 family protein [Gammaproteobacteria bacterium]|nr:RMD1 family protein [Gammaproteobacteria bacterium]